MWIAVWGKRAAGDQWCGAADGFLTASHIIHNYLISGKGNLMIYDNSNCHVCSCAAVRDL